ncbi:type I polyketide synthase, partial [Streptomyces sp. NPDC050504]|uniref:type I polyketide synthase n=1 Tax=Streptomyces sp. NPDC050504 TaxID=3365618 RepID=UPI0037B428B0
HHTGHNHIQELTLHTPLTLTEQTAVRLRVTVEEADDSTSATLSIDSQADDGTPAQDAEWTRHAVATITTVSGSGVVDTAFQTSAWPPAQAVPIDVTGLYESLTDRGYVYGELFQGLTSAWRLDNSVYAEVRLPQDIDTTGYGVHPALLDAALHANALTDQVDDELRLPFAWSGVTLHATGATALRVRLTATAPDVLSLDVADPHGLPVATVESLSTRPAADTLRAPSHAPRRNSLFQLDWTPLPGSAATTTEPTWAVIGTDAADLFASEEVLDPRITAHPDLSSLVTASESGTPTPSIVAAAYFPPQGHPDRADQLEQEADPLARAHRSAEEALALVQEFLNAEALASSRLLVMTRGAVAVDADTSIQDLGASTVWGLIRTAQSENPQRFILLDLDDSPASIGLLDPSLVAGEPQLALRAGTLHAPRLTRATLPTKTTEQPLNPNGTTLITGGTGTLGTLIAHHLVTHHGIRHLHLASRQGPNAQGATALHNQLTALGAHVTITACDTSNPEQLADMLATIPDSHPLTAVIHTAGTTADATLTNLTTEQLHTVLQPKVDAAWHLHHLTQHHNLAAFVLFSSAAGILGNPGQANYAAANTFLDTLAHHRHTQGLPATSLAWGLWQQTSTITTTLTNEHHTRLNRNGIHPLPTSQALTLLDTTLTTPQPHLIPIALDFRALREIADGGLLPPLLSKLVQPNAHSTAQPRDSRTLLRQLAPLTEGQRDEFLLDLVRTHIAHVLGHATPLLVDPEKGLLDMGFDSLTAVELRNRVNAAAGLRLPPTLVFDYPTAKALAGHLATELIPDDGFDTDTGAGADLTGDTDMRRVINTIPVSRIREAGLMEALLRLVDTGSDVDAKRNGTGHGLRHAEAQEEQHQALIESADVDDLIRLALGDDSA